MDEGLVGSFSLGLWSSISLEVFSLHFPFRRPCSTSEFRSFQPDVSIIKPIACLLAEAFSSRYPQFIVSVKTIMQWLPTFVLHFFLLITSLSISYIVLMILVLYPLLQLSPDPSPTSYPSNPCPPNPPNHSRPICAAPVSLDVWIPVDQGIQS